VGYQPDCDKIMRMHAQTAMIENALPLSGKTQRFPERHRGFEPSRNWAVNDLVVMLASGERFISWRYRRAKVAFCGMETKPFSIIAVCACIRMILSQSGW